MRLCRAIDQTPASFLRHRKDWPQRRVVLMQSSEREEGIFCHSRAPMVARVGFGVEGLAFVASSRVLKEVDWKVWRVFLSPRVTTSHDAWIVVRSIWEFSTPDRPVLRSRLIVTTHSSD